VSFQRITVDSLRNAEVETDIKDRYHSEYRAEGIGHERSEKYLKPLLLDLEIRNQTLPPPKPSYSFLFLEEGMRASFAPSRLRTIMEVFEKVQIFNKKQSQNLAVTIFPRNWLLQYRIASVAPITMSIQTPQADVVTLSNSSWQCIQAQTKDYLDEIAETMLWLGSLHLQHSPLQVSYVYFPVSISR
jgi:hypothetical protein